MRLLLLSILIISISSCTTKKNDPLEIYGAGLASVNRSGAFPDYFRTPVPEAYSHYYTIQDEYDTRMRHYFIGQVMKATAGGNRGLAPFNRANSYKLSSFSTAFKRTCDRSCTATLDSIL